MKLTSIHALRALAAMAAISLTGCGGSSALTGPALTPLPGKVMSVTLAATVWNVGVSTLLGTDFTGRAHVSSNDITVGPGDTVTASVVFSAPLVIKRNLEQHVRLMVTVSGPAPGGSLWPSTPSVVTTRIQGDWSFNQLTGTLEFQNTSGVSGDIHDAFVSAFTTGAKIGDQLSAIAFTFTIPDQVQGVDVVANQKIRISDVTWDTRYRNDSSREYPVGTP